MDIFIVNSNPPRYFHSSVEADKYSMDRLIIFGEACQTIHCKIKLGKRGILIYEVPTVQSVLSECGFHFSG